MDFTRLLRALAHGGADFIIVGGVAAALHGAARATYDLDIVYSRAPGNLDRLAAALAPLEPYLRGAPAGLPFALNAATLASGLNFTLTTRGGAIDLFGEITGGGTYEALIPHCIAFTIDGMTCYCLNLAKLIEVKRAAGRPKDLDALAELEVLRDEYQRGQ